MQCLEHTMWQMKIKLKKVNNSTDTTDKNMHTYTSKTSEHQALTKVKRVMPDTPEKRAHIIQKISISHQVSQILARKGALINKHVKRKIIMGEAVMES